MECVVQVSILSSTDIVPKKSGKVRYKSHISHLLLKAIANIYMTTIFLVISHIFIIFSELERIGDKIKSKCFSRHRILETIPESVMVVLDATTKNGMIPEDNSEDDQNEIVLTDTFLRYTPARTQSLTFPNVNNKRETMIRTQTLL